MRKNKLRKLLLMLSVMSAPAVVNEVIDENIAEANYAGNGLYYENGVLANWWYDDGSDWYFFKDGRKLTGYGKDNSGTKYFVNGKYANGVYNGRTYIKGQEVSSEKNGYVSGLFYKNGELGNWWYDDGSDWYFFKDGRKLTGYGKDNSGTKYFVNGKYANGVYNGRTYIKGQEVSSVKNGYVSGLFYKNGELGNWWYDDGSDWYFFKDGRKLTGYGKDNSGEKYFVNGKYANGVYNGRTYRKGQEVSSEKNGYVSGLFYKNGELGNWWYDDGSDWYFFKDGRKLTGYGKDNSGEKYFVNGKYANGVYNGRTYRNGQEVSSEKNGYVSGLFYKNGELGNWWYDDGSDWYFFKDGIKLTGYGKDNSGTKYFVNGKYANGVYNGRTYKNGVLYTSNNISSVNGVNIKNSSGKKLADISQHNGYIDFSKLKNEVDGVIIRVGYGTVGEDKRWREYVNGAIANGIPYGFYWYSYALNETHAKQEATMFLNAIKGYKPEYPIYIDMEDADYWKQNQGKKHMANTWLGREEIIKIHINEYEKAGYYGGVYASRSWFDAMSNDLTKYARWVAHWTENPNTYKNTNYGMHQYTSKGSANGVRGNLDLNTSHVDYPSIIKQGGFNNWKIAY